MSIHGLESRYGIVMDGTAAEHVREAIPVSFSALAPGEPRHDPARYDI